MENTEAKMILRADLPEGNTHYIYSTYSTCHIQYQCLFQEKGIVEGPWLLPWSDDFFLLYSTGGGYTDAGYSIWAAKATNLTGPYTKATQVTPSTITTMLRQGST